MNTKGKIFFCLLAFLIVVGAKDSFAQKRFEDGDPITASVKGKGNFIELSNGYIVETKKLEYKTSAFGKERFVIDSAKEYKGDEVVAYQMNKMYYRRFDNKYHFTVRIIGGKISVYTASLSNAGFKDAAGNSSIDKQYYIQKGDNEPVQVLKASNLKDMVSDYEPAYILVKKLPGYANKSKKIEEAISIYNERK